MKKNILILPLLLFLFLFDSTFIHAFTIIEKSGKGIKSGPTYDSARDEYIIELWNRDNGGDISNYVNKIEYKFYGSDSTFTNVNTEKIFTTPQHYVMNHSNCLGFYEITFYYNDEQRGYVKFESTQIQNNRCDSGGNQDDNVIGDGGDNCICLAIGKLNDTTEQIRDSLAEVNPKLDQISNDIKENSDHLLTIDTSINDFHDEFKTDLPFNPPTVIDTPDYLVPETNTHNHSDSNIYFEEPDYDDVPPPLPLAPEPEHWEGFLPEKELNKDDELEKETWQQDKELSKDVFEKDKELSKDTFEKDQELTQDFFQKDQELTKDQFQKDQEFTKDIFQKDQEFTKETFQKTHEYDQTNNEFERTEWYEQTYP